MRPAQASNQRALFLAPPPALLDELVESLTREGIDVLGVVATPFEAIEAFERDPVDVILVRRDLGREDAFEAGKEILRRAPEAKLVLFGALDDEYEVVLAIEIGFQGLILEDVSPAAFADVIASLLRDDAPSPRNLPWGRRDVIGRLTARERSVCLLWPSPHGIPQRLPAPLTPSASPPTEARSVRTLRRARASDVARPAACRGPSDPRLVVAGVVGHRRTP